MPLNIQDSEDQNKPARGGTKGNAVPPLPPLPEPSGSRKGVLLWILLIVALASAVFLLIQFGVIPMGGAHRETSTASRETPPAQSTETPPQPPAAQPKTPQTPPAASTGQPPAAGGKELETDRAAALRDRLLKLEGDYTIIISAFHDEADAEELSQRWEKAGYPSFVQHASGWYRVALGRYSTVAVAKEEAEKLRQAFEEGYWIAKAQP